jgi:SAM-dependent methyltransferase
MNAADTDVFAETSYAQSCRSYRSLNAQALQLYLDEVEALLSQGAHPQPIILDAGCGAGGFTMPLARLAGAHSGHLIALDSSPVMLEIVQRAVSRHHAEQLVDVRHGDLLSVRLPDPSALVWASDIVHVVPALDLFSRSVFELLGRGGAIAIRMSSRAQLRSYEWGAFFPKALSIDLARHPDTDDVTDSLARAGFHDIKTQEIDESEWMPRRDYLRRFESRYLSSLRLVDHAHFTSGLAEMKGAFSGRAQVFRNARTTLISARGGSRRYGDLV